MKCITLLDDKNANFHLDRKKVIFSHAYRGLSRSFHGVTIHVKPPGFKQLNWRIREHLSQAINNGSWYKLSFLVSEDAMIVPATCIYSVWRFTQNSWDMGINIITSGFTNVIRDGPFNRRWGDSSPKKIPARETCLKKILQAVIPKNYKSYALEKDSCRQEGFLKKFLHQNFFTTAPIISNGPTPK